MELKFTSTPESVKSVSSKERLPELTQELIKTKCKAFLMSKTDTSMKQERTFVMIKPEGVKRQLIGDVIKKLEKTGLKLVAMKLVQATPEMVEKHYPSDEGWLTRVGGKTIKGYEKLGIDLAKEMGTTDPLELGKIIKSWLVKYMSSSPALAMIWEGNRARDIVRKIAGETQPLSAASGALRGDFSIDSFEYANRQFRALFNLIHASETKEEAENEMSLWFNENEIVDYTTGFELVWNDLLEKIK